MIHFCYLFLSDTMGKAIWLMSVFAIEPKYLSSLQVLSPPEDWHISSQQLADLLIHRDTNLFDCSLSFSTRDANWIVADAKIVDSHLSKICMHDYTVFTRRVIKY